MYEYHINAMAKLASKCDLQGKTQEEIKTSHEKPVSVALYNENFEAVVSCDDGSYIALWDIENGKLMSKFGKAHKDPEVIYFSLTVH